MKKQNFLLIIFVFHFSLFTFHCYSQVPDWIWAKGAGGTRDDAGYAVAVDSSGNIYMAGVFTSPSITFGSTILTLAGYGNVFLAKYDDNGNPLWAKSAVGSVFDMAFSLAVDISGNSYVTGYFKSPTIAFDTIILTNTGNDDLFLAKYDAGGNVLWAKNAAGTGNDFVHNVALDESGNVYLAGFYESPTLTIDTITLTNMGANDIFLAKYNSNGNVLWAKSYGGMGDDEANSCATDVSGNIYLTGYFESPTLTVDTCTLTNAGYSNIFLVKYNPNGEVLWAKSEGGTMVDVANSIAADISGKTYLAGYFYSSTITFGSTTLMNRGDKDIFLASFDTNGNALWARSAGGTDLDEVFSVAVDVSGNSYLAGYFLSSLIHFDSTALMNSGGSDIFLADYSNNGNLRWAKRAGGPSYESAFSVAVNASGNAYMTGYFKSDTITFDTASLNIANVGYNEIFLAKSAGSIMTGINKPGKQSSFSVFPNPSTNNIEIVVSKKSIIEIFNIQGQTVKKIHADKDHSCIDVSALPGGVYVVEVKTEKGVSVGKFVKE